MDITQEFHNNAMLTTFSDDEAIKIINFIDKVISRHQSNVNDLSQCLVDLFKSIPEDKKTKIFLYQILVINGLIDDGINNKNKLCPHWHTNCMIRDDMKHRFGKLATRQNVCHNINVCILIPYMQVSPPFYKTTKEKLYLEENYDKDNN